MHVYIVLIKPLIKRATQTLKQAASTDVAADWEAKGGSGGTN